MTRPRDFFTSFFVGGLVAFLFSWVVSVASCRKGAGCMAGVGPGLR